MEKYLCEMEETLLWKMEGDVAVEEAEIDFDERCYQRFREKGSTTCKKRLFLRWNEREPTKDSDHMGLGEQVGVGEAEEYRLEVDIGLG
ncbi:hypothetical protein L6452_14366 [Arctium lappa]|uniref:Uncharacterized protein n=1 Tax=Arctium lappa TaxID=4217 RepID=A0ACB9CKV0_ARCLA|nr:hypothetical protein L6452_14366 [Arctium lappa]